MKKAILFISILLTLLSTTVAFAQVPYSNITGSGADAALQGQSTITGSQTAQQVSQTAATCPNGSICYTPLEPFNNFDARQNGYASLPYYLSTIFKIVISFGALSAVVMLVWGGITYIVSDAVDMKSKAKKRIQAALLGLALLASSYLILNTINPNLLQFNFNVGNLSNTANQDSTIPVTTKSNVDTSTGVKTATSIQMANADSALGVNYTPSPAGGDQYFLFDPKAYDTITDKGVKDYENYCEQSGALNAISSALGNGSRFETKPVAGSVFDAPGKTALVCVAKTQ